MAADLIKQLAALKENQKTWGTGRLKDLPLSTIWETLSHSSLANIKRNSIRCDVKIKHRLSKTLSKFPLGMLGKLVCKGMAFNAKAIFLSFFSSDTVISGSWYTAQMTAIQSGSRTSNVLH